ncbi:MAG: TetR family transcriptional regulator [Nocardia sp.]|nr:TetR family transcriptional regulator [Nocardia sp.]
MPVNPVDQRERPNARGTATRQAILLAAERLFAERGIEATALRDIALAAGQKNNVAVQYHFGDRDGLVTAITAYRGERSERIRADMLADLLASQRQPKVRDLVRAYVLSVAGHLGGDDNHYLTFISRLLVERGGYLGLRGAVGASVVPAFLSLLTRLLPNHPREVLDERWLIVMTTTAHTLARYQIALRTGDLPAPLEDLLGDLIDLLAAGVSAPVSSVAGNRSR